MQIQLLSNFLNGFWFFGYRLDKTSRVFLDDALNTDNIQTYDEAAIARWLVTILMLWLLAQVFAAVFVHFIIDRIGSQTCFLGAAASVFISIFVQAIVGAPHSLHIFIVDHFSTSFFSKVSEIAGNKFCQELLVSSPFFERFFIFFIPRVSGMLFSTIFHTFCSQLMELLQWFQSFWSATVWLYMNQAPLNYITGSHQEMARKALLKIDPQLNGNANLFQEYFGRLQMTADNFRMMFLEKLSFSFVISVTSLFIIEEGLEVFKNVWPHSSFRMWQLVTILAIILTITKNNNNVLSDLKEEEFSSEILNLQLPNQLKMAAHQFLHLEPYPTILSNDDRFTTPINKEIAAAVETQIFEELQISTAAEHELKELSANEIELFFNEEHTTTSSTQLSIERSQSSSPSVISSQCSSSDEGAQKVQSTLIPKMRRQRMTKAQMSLMTDEEKVERRKNQNRNYSKTHVQKRNRGKMELKEMNSTSEERLHHARIRNASQEDYLVNCFENRTIDGNLGGVEELKMELEGAKQETIQRIRLENSDDLENTQKMIETAKAKFDQLRAINGMPGIAQSTFDSRKSRAKTAYEIADYQLKLKQTSNALQELDAISGVLENMKKRLNCCTIGNRLILHPKATSFKFCIINVCHILLFMLLLLLHFPKLNV
eukprot:NP_496393.2 Uncharacterized protein CELE_F37H8.2 [Caenorhabditis elegans]